MIRPHDPSDPPARDHSVHLVPAAAIAPELLPSPPPDRRPAQRFILLPVYEDDVVEIAGVRFRASEDGEEGEYQVSYSGDEWTQGWSVDTMVFATLVEAAAEGLANG